MVEQEERVKKVARRNPAESEVFIKTSEGAIAKQNYNNKREGKLTQITKSGKKPTV